MSEGWKCPNCSGEMKKGYVVSRLVEWSDRKFGFWSIKGSGHFETVIRGGYPYNPQYIEAYKCEKCNLIVFQYRKTT